MTSYAVIDCAGDWPVYRERFRKLFSNPKVFNGKEKEFPENPDAVVITGSTSNMTSQEEWIEELVEKTAEYIEKGIPVLGICFGHQIIAKAVGGKVERMEDLEIGYKPIRFSKSQVFSNLKDVERPFSTHYEKITDLPDCLTVTARSEKCIQGIEHLTKPVFGVQFHPELTPEISRKAIRTKDIEEERKEELLAEVNDVNFERAKNCLHIIEEFKDIAESEPKKVRELISDCQAQGI